MFRRSVSAAVVVVAFAGLALAKDYKGSLTKVDTDGKKITFKVEGEDKAKTFTYTDATKFYLTIKGEKKEVPATFLRKLDKGVQATITADDEKVTQVTLGGEKKKEKDDK